MVALLQFCYESMYLFFCINGGSLTIGGKTKLVRKELNRFLVIQIEYFQTLRRGFFGCQDRQRTSRK